jgi:diacylglycerol O-acyltransferase / wax synthase
VITVLSLDRSPDWAEVRERFDLVTRTLPMFRQRVVVSPPTPPRWEYDPDFDLDYHMRRVGSPETGTFDAVLEMARVAAMQDFDRSRALWETTLIDGLENGSAAVLCKFHHALTDGVGGIQIAKILFSVAREGLSNYEPVPAEPAVVPPSWLSRGRDAWCYETSALEHGLMAAFKGGPRVMYAAVRRPVETVRSAAATAASVYRTVRPINQTGSPLAKGRGLIRRLGVHEVPMAPLRKAAHCCDGTLDDAFVAGVTGGLRRYHEKHGVAVGDLHLTMPVSLRKKTDEMGGNRITLLRFDVPVGEPDPAQRIRAIHERASAARHERSLPYTQLIAGALNLMPRWYITSVLRHVDFVASDVPGIPVPVFLGGVRVRKQYAFGPTIGAAVNVTLLTYMNSCSLGINVDTAAIPDYPVFHEAIVAGFDEVLALAN